MDELDQSVAEEHTPLVDVDKARAWVAERVIAPDGMVVMPDELPALEELVEEWRCAAVAVALDLGEGHHVNFLRIIPILRMDMPATAGMSQDEAMDAFYDARDATQRCDGYRLEVVRESTERVAEVVEKMPRILARQEAARQARAEAEAARRARRALRRTGTRRRGAGRPSHRRRPRANAPPSDDEGPAEPEPDLVARRRRCRAVCRLGPRR